MEGWKVSLAYQDTRVMHEEFNASPDAQRVSDARKPAYNIQYGKSHPWRAANGTSTDTVPKRQRWQLVMMTGVRLTIGSQLPLYCRVPIAIYPLSSSLTLAMLVRVPAAAVARMCKLAQLCAAPTARCCYLTTHMKVLSNIESI